MSKDGIRMTRNGRTAWNKIDTIKMFSEHGWKRVHEKCGHLRDNPHAFSDVDLANGCTEFMIIWFEDNGIEGDWECGLGDEHSEERVNDRLLSRYVDYLQRD